MDEQPDQGRQSTRVRKETELAARRYQRNVLVMELDHFIQTHEDSTPVRERLAEVDAAIARIEQELRDL